MTTSKFAILILSTFAFSSFTMAQAETVEKIEAFEYIPERTEKGHLKFSLHNLNPLNIYRALTQGVKINSENDIDPKRNCKTYEKSAKVCSECDEGYFLDKNAIVAGFCTACSEKIKNCFSCHSVFKKEKPSVLDKVLCDNCDFPRMPSKNQSECIGRKVLLYYFIGYVAIAIVLAVLTCIENPQNNDEKIFGKNEPSVLTKGLISENNESIDESNETEDN